MMRYALILVSLLLAADKWTDQNLTGFDTATGRVLFCLTYAFTPAGVGLVIALMKRTYRRWRGKPDTFSSDWHWVWGVLLVLLIAAHLIPQIKS